MPWIAFVGPFIPFIAMLPPAIAAMWIANRWFKSREGGSQVRSELTALREEVTSLRETQAEMQERLDFSERMLSQLREGRGRELPNPGRG
jgi:hypothetical protein